MEDQLCLPVLQWLTLSSKVGPYLYLDTSEFGNPGSHFCTDFLWELKYSLIYNTTCENNSALPLSLSLNFLGDKLNLKQS